MSLYNTIYHHSPMAPLLLHMMGRVPQDFPRFRDCYLQFGPEHGPLITVYTRTGGENRKVFGSEIDRCASYSGFHSEVDCNYEDTYAYFRYHPPAQFRDLVSELWLSFGHEKRGGDLFRHGERSIQSGNGTLFNIITSRMAEINKQLRRSIESGVTVHAMIDNEIEDVDDE